MFWNTKTEPINEIKETQLVESTTTAVTVEVKDIKEHLVDAYEESKKQRRTIDRLNGIIDNLNEIKMKYDATLVTLDEYSNRIEEEKGRNIGLTEKIESKNHEIENLREQVNNFKIAKNNYDRERSKIEREIKVEQLDRLKTIVAGTKGHISKAIIINLLEKEVD